MLCSRELLPDLRRSQLLRSVVRCSRLLQLVSTSPRSSIRPLGSAESDSGPGRPALPGPFHLILVSSDSSRPRRPARQQRRMLPHRHPPARPGAATHRPALGRDPPARPGPRPAGHTIRIDRILHRSYPLYTTAVSTSSISKGGRVDERAEGVSRDSSGPRRTDRRHADGAFSKAVLDGCTADSAS